MAAAGDGKMSSSSLLQPSPTVTPVSNQVHLQHQAAWTTGMNSTAVRTSINSGTNIFHSLSTIHRSTSILPNSLLDMDAASSAGLQVIRPDTHPEAFIPVPPDGGWGWVVVLAAFTTNLVIDGICVSFGIMVNDLVEHFEVPVASVMLIGSLLVGVYQIIGPVAAGLVNRFGCRTVGIVGSLLATVSLFLSACMPTIELMIVTYGICAGAAFGFLHLPSVICVSFYFDSRRALAIGLTSCGTPLGAMIFAPLSEILLQKYGWSNTLILFAGVLLNCTALAALYRPLTPTLLLEPMKASEAEAIKSLLHLAGAAGEEPDSVGGGGGAGRSTTPFASQRDLRDQPVLEEDESEETDSETDETRRKPKEQEDKEAVSEKDKEQVQPSTSTEGAEQKPGVLNPKVCREASRKQRHHRHYRRRKPHKTLAKQLRQQYDQWVQSIRARVRSASSSAEAAAAAAAAESVAEAAASQAEDEAHKDAENDASNSSHASTCRSSCEEDGSHWDSSCSSSYAPSEPEDDDMKALKEKKHLVGKKTSNATRQLQSSVELIFSAPSLNHPSLATRGSKVSQQSRYVSQGVRRRSHVLECRPVRTYTRPIPHHSAVHLAHASVPRQRCVSTATMSLLTRSQVSGFDSSFFVSASRVGGGGGVGDLGEGPVIVELPHDSISVEDYARPLYRKDIFFPGSVKRQIEQSSASIAAAVSTLAADSGPTAPTDEQINSASLSEITGGARRKITSTGAQFGSSIIFGDNVPLPPINESAVPDANWTSSCLLSLTKIPLPDVFGDHTEAATVGDDAGVENGKREEDDEEAKMWRRIRSETGINISEGPADGIYRVPRSHSLCGWWLCWETQKKRNTDIADEEADEMERFKKSLMDGNYRESKQILKFPQRTAKIVLIRRCAYLPKSILDVLVTMMNLSLLKEKSFAIFCVGNFIAMIGIYVPLFFVCDLAEKFGIPKSQSAYLLTVYGGASVVSRLTGSWVAGRPNVSSLMLSTAGLLLAGASVCIMPFWGSLLGQVFLMIVFGLTLSPFFSLASIVLCDILSLEELTNAYGIATMLRGIASAVGSPAAGIIVASTENFIMAMLLAGSTVIIGGLLYVIILILEHSKIKAAMKELQSAEDDEI